MLKVVPKIFQSLLIAVVLGMTFLFSYPLMTAPAVAAGCDAPYVPLLRDTGWVNRINVADLDEALEFYEYGLGLTCNSTFYAPPFWAEVYSEDDPSTSIGLSANPYAPFEPGQVMTKIVPDLSSACTELKRIGIPVEKVDNPGLDVCLVFFQDPFGNELGYRQEGISGYQCDDILDYECNPGF